MTPGTSDHHLLTVLHAAERTGPPLFALQFLRWLRQHHPNWRATTLFLDGGGALEASFAELGTVMTAGSHPPFTPGGRLTHRWYVRRQIQVLRRQLEALGAFDVAHVHCAGSMRIRPALPSGTPVLCHLHELNVGLELHLGPLAQRYVGSADHYVAVSDGVREEFLSRFPVDPTRVERQWGFIDVARLPTVVDRSELRIPNDAFVVVNSGVRHWRKAPELFVRTALTAKRRAPDVPWMFAWIGGSDSCGLESLVRDADSEQLVTFVPHQRDPLRWFCAADAFFLSAREDAFPLVGVEAAASGLPIVTFDNGGAAELVRNAQCGVTVPFADVDAAAAALAGIARDREASSELGTRARRFAHLHLLLENAGPALFSTIEQTRKAAL